MNPTLRLRLRARKRLRALGSEDPGAVHPLLCPVCWNTTAVWLGWDKEKTECVVCEGEFRRFIGDA